ncbi:MAG: exosortase/archaeosortase family protein [Pirellulales bacterium]|nr:exosortase/archaeosortase family protein [Pirellulales bacterium]
MQMQTNSNSSTSSISPENRKTLIGLGILVVLLAATYYQALYRVVNVWYDEPDYVYGFLVIPFSAFLLWDRRDMLKDAKFQMSWWSIPCIVLGMLMRFYGNFAFNQAVEAFSMIPLLTGIVLFVAGWPAIRWSWSAIAFIVFMIPLPSFIEGTLGQELQKIGTNVSVFTLQTLGMPAIAEGNVIVLTNAKLGVVEACSGIRMLMLFFAACVGAAFLLRQRDLVTRILIVLSAIPIAVIANVCRITITAILYETVNQELGDMIFHDLAGWFMMPLAIALLWLETGLLAKLFEAPEREAPLAVGAIPVYSAPKRATPTTSGKDKDA